MSEALFAQVAVENTVYHFDRLFTYAVPDALRESAVPGAQVTVPFGAGNRQRVGVIFSFGPAPEGAVKPLTSVLAEAPVLEPDMLELARWMKERTYCTLFEAVKLMLPAAFHYRLRDSYVLAPGFKDFDREQYSPIQWQLILLLRQAGKAVPAAQMEKRLGISDSAPEFQALLESGIVCKVNTAAGRVKDQTRKMARPIPDFSGKLSPRQQEVYRVLCDVGEASERELCYFTGASASVVKALAQKGAAELFEYEVYRRPSADPLPEERGEQRLSPAQQRVYEELLAQWKGEGPRCALLYGVTGSGKTAVYLRLIRAVLEAGRSAIVMVPEISLTGQAIRRFRAVFGDSVAVFHSGLSLGERMDEWKRVRRGEARIAVGTRSAVFAPVRNLGLIVIDEEQEHTYRSEASPRYDAREVARYRCGQHGAFCVLSSATPSLETAYLARRGRYGFHRLEERFGSADIPQVTLTDMNFDGLPGDAYAIGNTLARALVEQFEAGRQSIVLLNRRGYHTWAVCGSCHQPVTCPYCSISLTYHSANGRLMCHYCGHSAPFSKTCPACGSESVRFRGLGTQRAEEQLRELLPEARVLRLDTDSVAARYALDRKLEAFARGEYDVMVGTQMVAKGLDFENVTLVGVLSADQSLYSDDYRSNERTFDLLTQVVGRAGRGRYPGRAIIQTWAPEHPVLHFAAAQDYFGFYEQEIAFRRAMLYPPFVDLLVFGFVGEREGPVARAAGAFLQALTDLAAREYAELPLRVLRPSPAAVYRVGGKYRYKLIVKCRSGPRLREMAARLLVEFAGRREYHEVTAYADPDPYHIL